MPNLAEWYVHLYGGPKNFWPWIEAPPPMAGGVVNSPPLV